MFRRDQKFYFKASSFPKKQYSTPPIDFSKCSCFQIQQIQCNETELKSQQIFQYKCFVFFNKDKVQMNLKNFYLKEEQEKELHFEQENFHLKMFFKDTREKASFVYSIEKWIIKNNLQKQHRVIKIVGKGGFASVMLTQRIRKNQKRQFAVKEIKKKNILNSKNFRYLENEIQALRTITHKNSLRIYEVYESTSSIYIVTEYIQGGTLQERLTKKRYISAGNAVKLTVQVLDLLREINKYKIIHRDIKPQNIMFKSEDSFDGLKLIDYGLCANFTDHSSESLLHDKSGTACYLAPELVGMSYLKKFYDEKADVFSIGIILYEILAGANPFSHSEYNESLILNFNCNINYDCLQVDDVVLKFVQGLTQKNPLKRFSAKEAIRFVTRKDSPKIEETKKTNNYLKKYSLQFPKTQRETSFFQQASEYYQVKRQKENKINQINIQKKKQQRKLSVFEPIHQFKDALTYRKKQSFNMQTVGNEYKIFQQINFKNKSKKLFKLFIIKSFQIRSKKMPFFCSQL